MNVIKVSAQYLKSILATNSGAEVLITLEKEIQDYLLPYSKGSKKENDRSSPLPICHNQGLFISFEVMFIGKLSEIDSLDLWSPANKPYNRWISELAISFIVNAGNNNFDAIYTNNNYSQ